MRLRDAIALHVGFWLYLIGGGGVFYLLETAAHTAAPDNEFTETNVDFCRSLMAEVNRSLTEDDNFTSDVMYWYQMINQTCLNVSSNEDSSASSPANMWDFTDALFLAMTILTTVGYGNPVTVTKAGKVFAVVYGFFGIPLGGILLASTSDYFSNHLLAMYNNQRKEREEKIAITVASAVFLIPGLLLLVFIPAAIFSMIEQWSYLDAFYYSFITLTTVGFGDIVAAQHNYSGWTVVYRLAVITWVIIGISYWAVIIAFVTKALKSKKLRRQWLKTTQSIAHHVDELKSTLDMMSQGGFVAHKSKNAFQFALQVAGTVGQFGPDLDNQLNVPGIATALNSRAKGRCGVHSLLEMSIKMISQPPTADSSNPATPDVPPEKTSRPPPLVDIIQTSEDSGLGPEIPPNPKIHFQKSKSSISLPPPKTAPSWPLPSKMLLKRTRSRPELIDSRRQERLKNLLIQAALILQEAEASRTALSPISKLNKSKPLREMPVP